MSSSTARGQARNRNAPFHPAFGLGSDKIGATLRRSLRGSSGAGGRRSWLSRPHRTTPCLSRRENRVGSTFRQSRTRTTEKQSDRRRGRFLVGSIFRDRGCHHARKLDRHSQYRRKSNANRVARRACTDGRCYRATQSSEL